MADGTVDVHAARTRAYGTPLEAIDPVGDPVRTPSSFANGYSYLPVRIPLS